MKRYFVLAACVVLAVWAWALWPPRLTPTPEPPAEPVERYVASPEGPRRFTLYTTDGEVVHVSGTHVIVDEVLPGMIQVKNAATNTIVFMARIRAYEEVR